MASSMPRLSALHAVRKYSANSSNKNYSTMYPLIFIGTWEIVAIVLVVLLLFGGKKIPELMKGLGKGVKSFKEGMNEVEKEINEAGNTPEKTDTYNKEEK